MKIRPSSKTGGVLLELGPQESQLPSQPALLPFKLKKILVPVDFSDCSKKALQYAIPFAKQFGAELTLLYVVPPYVGGPEPAPVDFETVEEGKRELAALQKTITGVIPSRTQVLLGVAPVEITEAAAKLGADLIIISTHGHTGVTRMLLGSTAEKVVRHARCPVLIVRECEREFVPAS